MIGWGLNNVYYGNGNGNNVNRVIGTVSRFCVSRTRRKAGEAVVVWGGGN